MYLSNAGEVLNTEEHLEGTWRYICRRRAGKFGDDVLVLLKEMMRYIWKDDVRGREAFHVWSELLLLLLNTYPEGSSSSSSRQANKSSRTQLILI